MCVEKIDDGHEMPFATFSSAVHRAGSSHCSGGRPNDGRWLFCPLAALAILTTR